MGSTVSLRLSFQRFGRIGSSIVLEISERCLFCPLCFVFLLVFILLFFNAPELQPTARTRCCASIERECVLYADKFAKGRSPPRPTGSGSLVQLGIPKSKSEGTLSSGFRRNETAQGGMRRDGDTTLRYNINFGVQRSCRVGVRTDVFVHRHTQSPRRTAALGCLVGLDV